MDLKRQIMFFIACSIYVSVSLKVNACPKNCKCSRFVLKCIGVGLKTIDFQIPLSIRYIDLSNNPSIKLEKHTFSKFKQLQHLRLKRARIKDPLYLPGSIEVIDLSDNELNASALKTMLRQGNMSRLIELYLSSNGIWMDKSVFSMLPRSLSVLEIGSNSVFKIAKNYLQGMKELKRLAVGRCRIREIESGAFDSLKKLKTLLLNENSIKNLRKGLFRFNVNLRNMYLDYNFLKELPDFKGIQRLDLLSLEANRIDKITSSQFSMDSIDILQLSNNRITSFNLNKTRLFEIDLSNNSITKIDDFVFSSSKFIRQLFLHKNKISYISPKAFDGVISIKDLFLQRNRLETLPKDVFKGIAIQNLFLFNNYLKSIEGLLNSMTSPPDTLVLFGNPGPMQLQGKDLLPMKTGSVVYIGCAQLKSISIVNGARAKIICSPSDAVKINITSHALFHDGFVCNYLVSQLNFYCRPCAIGKRGNAAGKCISCPAGGFYQDEMAALACKRCPFGQYVPPEKAPGKNPLECLTCPKGTNTNSSAGYRACPCLNGYARKYRFGPCEKCHRSGFKCKRDYEELRRGYWMSWTSMRTASNHSCKSSLISFMQNIDTKDDSYDRRTVRYECEMPKPHECPLKGSCHGGVNADCKKGYTGVLCAVCDNGFMKNFNKCTKCPSPVIAVVQCVAYVLAFIFVCWLITLTENKKLANDNDATEGNNQSDADERTFADVILSSLKILIGFYQVLIGIFHALDYIQWPTALKTTVNFFEYIQLAIIRIPSLHCIRPEWRMNAVSEFYFAFIATTSVLFVIVLYFAVKSIFLFYNTDDFRKWQKKCLINCLRAACLLLFAVYPIVSGHIVKILPPSCHRFCTAEVKGKCLHEVSFLRSDYSVKCLTDTSSMSNTLIIAYVTLIVPIGFPFALLILLWRIARHSEIQPSIDKLIPPINDQEFYVDENPYLNARSLVSNQDRDKGALKFALKFVYENYVASCWYWEVLETLRKLIMIVGIALFLQHTKVGLGSMIIIAIIFTTLHAIKSPIKDKFENFLQLLSLSIIPINLAVGAILHSTSVGDESIIGERGDSWALGVLLIVLNSLLVIFVIIRLLRAIIKKCSSSDMAWGRHGCCRRFMDCVCPCIERSSNFTQLPETDIMVLSGREPNETTVIDYRCL